jgi:hypothetical protein
VEIFGLSSRGWPGGSIESIKELKEFIGRLDGGCFLSRGALGFHVESLFCARV